jgi:hypothetical protein
MKIELLSSTKNQDINISDNAFSKDHQNRKLGLKLEVAARNHTDKKELAELELEL